MHLDSSISINELIVAIPMDASSKLSDLAYSANSNAVFRVRFPTSLTPRSWEGPSSLKVEERPQCLLITAVQKTQVWTRFTGKSFPLRLPMRSSSIFILLDLQRLRPVFLFFSPAKFFQAVLLFPRRSVWIAR